MDIARLWPADMPLVGSNMTLKVHAQRWVDAGVSVEFAVEHVGGEPAGLLRDELDVEGLLAELDRGAAVRGLVLVLFRRGAGDCGGLAPAAATGQQGE